MRIVKRADGNQKGVDPTGFQFFQKGDCLRRINKPGRVGFNIVDTHARVPGGGCHADQSLGIQEGLAAADMHRAASVRSNLAENGFGQIWVKIRLVATGT